MIQLNCKVNEDNIEVFDIFFQSSEPNNIYLTAYPNDENRLQCIPLSKALLVSLIEALEVFVNV